MEKTISTILGIFIFGWLNAQINLEFLNSNEAEMSKCYYAYPIDTNTTDIMYLELVPSVFETFYYRTDTKAFENMVGIDYTSYKPRLISVQEMATKFVERKIDELCMSDAYIRETMITLCKVETPTRYTTLNKIAVIRENDTLYVFKPQKIAIQKVIQKGSIRQISALEAQEAKNPAIKVKGNEWTEWREIMCSTGCGRVYPRIIDIQKTLKKLGYFTEEPDGIIGQSTKDALIRFQKDNNLRVGYLDFATTKKLGFY